MSLSYRDVLIMSTRNPDVFRKSINAHHNSRMSFRSDTALHRFKVFQIVVVAVSGGLR